MNLRGNLQPIKCDILHNFMIIFFVSRKVHSPYWPCSFLRNIFTPGLGDVLWNWPFFLTLQPCSRNFLTPANTDLKKNVSFWVLCSSWKFTWKVCNKVIWLTKHFCENHFIHFSGDTRKTAVMKVLENYQKNIFSSVPFKKLELSNLPTYNYSEN